MARLWWIAVIALTVRSIGGRISPDRWLFWHDSKLAGRVAGLWRRRRSGSDLRGPGWRRVRRVSFGLRVGAECGPFLSGFGELIPIVLEQRLFQIAVTEPAGAQTGFDIGGGFAR